ncbi:MAG: tRNA (adenosine(37)-N6)-dimethylallyltransferase MiaA [Peptoniphilaceae bacterium]|nr:tRNA (adenosine(37)-N6)-dimethylallyltransferase MiaA [Peptoniphilaceae bacterium]MDY4195827.1 tRNA (adenosine(37)-N6)-dimethylallyltransferase MiaA [Peptoniphilaceae bacterium]MDY6146326.1 tRNA (adenosine(37)-N6)-dimethylallyltransferase MiaA [Peptoniphilaceae bacterium]
MTSEKLVFIAGPTAVGKSELSIDLAQKLNMEILSMDSMQIYRGMNIGTAKLSQEEMQGIPHHLLDFVCPGERYTAERYQQDAYRILSEIRSRGHFPLFVGGTGLYMEAILHDFQFGGVNFDPELRAELQTLYKKDHGVTLYHMVKKVDSETARMLTPADRKKLIRAWEVYQETGIPLSAQKKEKNRSRRWDALCFVLTDEREALYRRIDQRVIRMIEEGLIEENQTLIDSGISHNAQAMKAIGYQEVLWYFRGIVNRNEMIRLIQKNSRNYAKRQLTWFRKDPGFLWLDRSKLDEEAIRKELYERTRAFLFEN